MDGCPFLGRDQHRKNMYKKPTHQLAGYVWRDERKRAKDEREPEITVDKIGCDDAAGRRKRRSESLFVVKEKGQHYIWERIYMQQAAISLKV